MRVFRLLCRQIEPVFFMFFRKRDKVVLTLTPQEARYARSILLRWRNKLLNAGKPTEDVEELILRLAR